MFEVFRAALTNSIIRFLQSNDFNCDLPYPNLPPETQAAMLAMYPVYIENYACNHAWFGGDLDPFVRSFPDSRIQGAMVAGLTHTAAIVARLSNIRAAANDDNLRLLAALDKIQTDCAAAGATARSREAESILAQEKINRASNYIVGVTEPLRVSVADRMLAVDLNAHFTQISPATQVAMRAMYRCLVGGFVGDFNEFSVAMDGVMRKLPEYLSLAAAEKEQALKYLTSMSAKLNAVRRALIDENDRNIDSLDAVLLNIYSQNIPVAVVANNALKYVQPAYFDKTFADALKNSIQDCLRYPVNFNNHRTQIPNGTLAAMTVMYPIFIQQYRGEAEFFCEAIDQYIKHNHRYLDLLDNYRLEAALTHFVSMIQKLQVYRRCLKDDNCIVLAEVFQRIPQDHLDIEFIVNQQCTFIEQALDNVNYNYRIAKKNAQIDAAAQHADAHAEINVCSAQLEQQSQGLKQNVAALEQKFKFAQDMIAQALNACELGDLEPIQKLKMLNDNDAWAWFCNAQPLSLAQAHGREEVAAYLVANQVEDVAQWEDVKEDVNKQDGWSCFDVAVGIKREDIVAYATKPEYSADKKYREFLSAEIKATLLDLVEYIDEESGAILAATPADERKVIEAMYPDMGERKDMCKLLTEAAYFKPKNQNKQDIEAKIDAYCTSEDVYLKYIRGYYGSEQMFSFMAEFEGAKPTSMVDIVARMLNKKIVIHNADKLSATEFEGEGEVHIHYYHKRRHFVAMHKVEVAQLNPELLANYKENLKAYAARNIANYNLQANKLIQQNLDNIQKDQAEAVAILQQQRELVDEQHQLQLTYIDSHFAALTEQALAQTKGEFERDADKQRTAKAVAENKWRAEIKAAIEANKRELDAAKKRAKRKKTQLLIALPVIVAASFYLGPLVASYLAPVIGVTVGTTAFVTTSAIASGVIGGGLSAAVSGGDVLKSAIEGGVLAFAGQQINAAVASLHRISRVTISAATLCTIRTVMHGGNLVNNVCFSAGGAILGEAFVPASNLAGQELLTQGQVLQLMFENTARVVISSVPALLMGKEDIPSIISSSIGVMGSVYAGNAANEAVSRNAVKQQQWLGKNKPVPNSKDALFADGRVERAVAPSSSKNVKSVAGTGTKVKPKNDSARPNFNSKSASPKMQYIFASRDEKNESLRTEYVTRNGNAAHISPFVATKSLNYSPSFRAKLTNFYGGDVINKAESKGKNLSDILTSRVNNPVVHQELVKLEEVRTKRLEVLRDYQNLSNQKREKLVDSGLTDKLLESKMRNETRNINKLNRSVEKVEQDIYDTIRTNGYKPNVAAQAWIGLGRLGQTLDEISNGIVYYGGEKLKLYPEGTYKQYRAKMNEEEAYYRGSYVGESTAANVAEQGAELVLSFAALEVGLGAGLLGASNAAAQVATRASYLGAPTVVNAASDTSLAFNSAYRSSIAAYAQGNSVSNAFKIEKLAQNTEQSILHQFNRNVDFTIRSPSAVAIQRGWGELSPRQANLLEHLSESGKNIIIKKNDINVYDIACLTARTGDEFAIFTLGSRRMILRGDYKAIEIPRILTDKLKAEQWKWSAHTHVQPGDLRPSGIGKSRKPSDLTPFGDRDVLATLDQEQSLLLDSIGRRRVFTQQYGDYIDPLPKPGIRQ
jgi:hypothetical protein